MQSILFFTIASLIFFNANSIADEHQVDDPSVIISSTKDPQWMSYRLAYRALEWHESYSKPKNFIRLSFQLWPKEEDTTLNNLHLKLIGDHTNIELELDEGLQISIPKLKSAYEDNAEFLINRRAGSFYFQNTGSINLNLNGIYPVKDLRIACDQLLTYLRDARTIFRLQTIGKKCTGVTFAFGATIEAPKLALHNEQNEIIPLNTIKPSPKKLGKNVEFKFLLGNSEGEIIAYDLPITINGIYE
jgi:hypothetical protein